jgi:disulfide bond formation protein DsbB
MNLASFVNGLLSVATVITQVGALFFCVLLLSRSARGFFPQVLVFLKKRALLLSFFAASVALLGSLTYSDILGYEPCKLCWIQRIFMYPQVLIFGLALWKKDVSALPYGIVFSSVGGAVALYHYMTQLGWNPLNLPCAAVGYSTSCAKVFVLNFGYITIPVMAFSVFVFIATLSLIAYKNVTSHS